MRLPGLALGLLMWSTVSAYGVDSAAVDQAVQRGVAALKALQDKEGKWMYTFSHENGATALAGLTLMECGVPASDPAIQSAAKYLREGSYTEKSTYDLALMVLFMDRLNHVNDTPLIESMLVRLLGGQQVNGAWSYECTPLAMEEITRLRAEVSGNRSLSGQRDLGKLPPKGKRTESDLTSEIRGQLELIRRGGTFARQGDTLITVNGDNSNTQFATLALWVGRRYGIPTQPALVRSDARFRATQNNDGGWSYSAAVQAISPIYRTPSMATMTCAGLMALACGHGSVYELKTAKDSKSSRPDLERDAQMKLGLAALATAI
ncbi:MAG: hypothetical protein ACKO23_05375, partial [Gemmataceae bacterium]